MKILKVISEILLDVFLGFLLCLTALQIILWLCDANLVLVIGSAIQ